MNTIDEQNIDQKKMLKLRKSVMCQCGNVKKQKDRLKYGTCRCDGYCFHYAVTNVLANALFQYIADASQHIIRDDFAVIEKHAHAIRTWADADNWDLLSKDKKVISEYKKKEKAWKEAMKWLTENWQGLWW